MNEILKNIPAELLHGTEHMINHFELLGKECISNVSAEKSERCYIDHSSGIKIFYREKKDFFRLFANAITDTYIKEEKASCFKKTGVLLDMSRGGVMTVNGVCRYLDFMASFGLDTLYLYIEDTYKIKSRKYFGYMRGAYSVQELREIDNHAADYGIEVVAAIQTYSHMEQYLHWDEAVDVRDTARTMLADCDKTYELIEEMIETISSALRSRRIHVGLDESQDMLRGKYLDIHGTGTDKSNVFFRHLARVCDIVEQHGMRPVMWSDMIFRNASENGDDYYGDITVSDSAREKIPKNISLVYWNYDGDGETDAKMLAAHRKISDDVIFAGRVHTSGQTSNNLYTIQTLKNSLPVCKKSAVDEVMLTVWGNDGCESDYFMTLPGLLFLSEFNFHGDFPEEEVFRQHFNRLTAANYDVFMKMSLFQNNFDDDRPLSDYVQITQGKRILWQDIMLGFLDCYLEKYPLSAHYEKIAAYMHDFKKNLVKGTPSHWIKLYRYLESLFDVMAKKSYIAERLKKAYDTQNTEFLSLCAKNLLPQLSEASEILYEAQRELWFETKKPQGYEYSDIRYAGLCARCRSAAKRIEQYLCGDISELAELCEERLDFSPFDYSHYDLSTAYRPK